MALGERENRPGLGHAAAANQVRDEARLARRDSDVLRECAHGGRRLCLDRCHYRFCTCVFWAPAWPRKWRVGANSPSLCPAICAEMNTGTCLRPSWTAIVWPTISGKIVEARDQVRIM